MATYVQNLTTTRDQIAARLAEMTVSPKPNYSIDGVSYSWDQLRMSLSQQLKDLNEMIQMADGGFEVRSTGVT
jgi:hypothetical protein